MSVIYRLAKFITTTYITKNIYWTHCLIILSLVKIVTEF